jgi:hypothetical protein
VNCNNITVLVILCKLTKKGSELDTFIGVANIFQESVTNILAEEMKSEDNREEVANFLLEYHPKVFLFTRNNCKLFLGKHGEVGDHFN